MGGSSWLRCVLLLLLAVICLESGAEARTRAKRRARLLYRRANIYFNLAEYKQAAKLYRRAYKNQPLAGFLFNIGQCHFNLGEYEEALRLYQRYLMEKPKAPNRADVEAQIAAAKKALAEKEAEEKARQQAEQAQASQPASTPASLPSETTEENVENEETKIVSSPDDSQPRRPSRRARIFLWSGVAATSTLLLVGIVTRIVAFDMSVEFNDDATPLDRQLELKDVGESLTLTSNVTLAVGAALAVATGAYYWFGYRRSVAATVAPTAGQGATVIIRTSF